MRLRFSMAKGEQVKSLKMLLSIRVFLAKVNFIFMVKSIAEINLFCRYYI